MSSDPSRNHLDRHERRRSLAWAHVNGALWSIGNGLTTGPLVSYFAQDLGAKGIELAILLALPAVVGLYRLFAPRWITLCGGAKRACLVALAASYLLLATLPLIVLEASVSASPRWALAAVIGLLCVHQLLEFIGTVALWSWLADLVPAPIRGRYFGRRNAWQLVVLVPTLLASGRLIDLWREHWPEQILLAYALVTGAGAILLLASLGPLVAMVPTPLRRIAPSSAHAGRPTAWLDVFACVPFRWLLVFGCWLSFFNGLTQVAQNVYPKQVLHIGLATLAVLQSTMRIGQIGVGLWAGGFSDRYGNRPTLVLGQLLVAAGPLCYFLSRGNWPSGVFWIGAAYVLWSAYAALNVCLPNLMLKLVPDASRGAGIAIYFAATSLAYAVSTVLGGVLFDALKSHGPWSVGPFAVDVYAIQFLAGWVTRSLAVVWLLLLAEPGAWHWSQIWRRRSRPGAALPQP
ncbi:MAG: MFS transporter [Pirellulales bacterium]|nr:MFS transporter [Pirellulales bacterium]